MIFIYDINSALSLWYRLVRFYCNGLGNGFVREQSRDGTGQGTIFDIELVTFDYSTRYREEHDRRVCLFADTYKYILRWSPAGNKVVYNQSMALFAVLQPLGSNNPGHAHHPSPPTYSCRVIYDRICIWRLWNIQWTLSVAAAIGTGLISMTDNIIRAHCERWGHAPQQ